MPPALFLLVLASVSLAAIAQVILRKAMLVAAPLPPLTEPLALVRHLGLNPWLWGGLGCFAVSVLLWLAVLSRVQVSAAYPMASMGYVLVAIASALWLGENLTPMRIAGLVLICAGVYLIARTA